MGITILLIAIFIEVALAIYGIITKSNHAKENGYHLTKSVAMTERGINFYIAVG